MFEKVTEPLVSRSVFVKRVITSIAIGFIAIASAQVIRMLGYYVFEHMSWVDAFVNAAMILSGMGPLTPLNTDAGKLFAGFYALFSGLSFILIISIIFAPILHRFFHKLHLDDSDYSKDRHK